MLLQWRWRFLNDWKSWSLWCRGLQIAFQGRWTFSGWKSSGGIIVNINFKFSHIYIEFFFVCHAPAGMHNVWCFRQCGCEPSSLCLSELTRWSNVPYAYPELHADVGIDFQPTEMYFIHNIVSNHVQICTPNTIICLHLNFYKFFLFVQYGSDKLEGQLAV